MRGGCILIQCVIGGDFNLPDINWEEETVLPYATSATVSTLLTLAKDFYLDQMITEPTRITETTANTLELFFASNPTLINKVETIQGISDHEPVFIESSLCPIKVKIPTRKVSQYKKADYEGMKKELRAPLHEFQQKAESEPQNIFGPPSRKQQFHLWKSSSLPKCSGNKPQKPWVTKEVKCLRRKLKLLFKRQHKTGAAKDI